METPLVSIACITYNHENYIRDTLEGFLMQKTNFPYEIIIHDDASTDNTARIIGEYEKKYPSIIKPIYQKENKYKITKRILITYVFPNCKGKYIAICEGDDYWIDSYKLQKQVDFLMNHKDYGAVFTHSNILYESSNKLIPKNDKIVEKHFNKGKVFKELLKSNPYVTCTVLFRLQALDKFEKINSIYAWKQGDYPMWLYIANKSNIGYLKATTSVYRIREATTSHPVLLKDFVLFNRSAFRIFFYFNGPYVLGLNKKEVKRLYLNKIINFIIGNNKTIEGKRYLKLINADLIIYNLIKVVIKKLLFISKVLP